MKRRLTAREWFLLCVLLVVAVVSAYIRLYYMPMTSRRDGAIEEAKMCRAQTEAAELRLTHMRQMEAELDRIFAENENPLGLAPYDNLQPVMFELNGILASANRYSLDFSTVDTDETIVQRSISVSFSSDSYGMAKGILQKLHDSAYRCMLDDINIAIGQENTGVQVDGTIVFFEYMK